jgi:bla regulator protein BlaR1
MIGEITNHLWQSTVFALAVALLALSFRKNRAEVRYWLWLSASLKFLVPFSLLIGVGIRVWDALPAGKIAAHIAAASTSQTIVEITQPFPGNFAQISTTHHANNWIPIAILALWTFGFFCVALMRARSWFHIRAAVHASTPINITGAIIPARSSATLLEPGVVGFLSPVLLLPEGILKKLTQPQLEAVLAHEQCHVRRRDNLTSSLHMLVEAIFWFHPIIWWIGAKLVEERERACDEAVLKLGNEPQIYAEGILNVCKSYLESPLHCVSGVTGSDLKKRIRAILADRVAGNLNLARKLALALIATTALAAPILVGVIGAPTLRAQSQSAGKLSFEVASIKEWVDGKGPADLINVGLERSGDRIISRCTNLAALLSYAYHLTMSVPVTGIPSWGRGGCGRTYENTFAIEATMPPGTTEEQSRLMMQTLLQDRFKLEAHWEKKDMPIFALVIGKGGFKLQPSDPAKDAPIPPHSIGCPPEDPGCHNIVAGSGPLSALASLLSRSAGRPVIDQTGLTGTYNTDLTWAGDTATDSPLPSLPAALREKFGLELKPEVGPVNILVIDHVEKPSPN